MQNVARRRRTAPPEHESRSRWVGHAAAAAFLLTAQNSTRPEAKMIDQRQSSAGLEIQSKAAGNGWSNPRSKAGTQARLSRKAKRNIQGAFSATSGFGAFAATKAQEKSNPESFCKESLY